MENIKKMTICYHWSIHVGNLDLSQVSNFISLIFSALPGWLSGEGVVS